jgi:uncharacterized membrane protein YhaH (DUF805 family)
MVLLLLLLLYETKINKRQHKTAKTGVFCMVRLQEVSGSGDLSLRFYWFFRAVFEVLLLLVLLLSLAFRVIRGKNKKSPPSTEGLPEIPFASYRQCLLSF